MRDVGRVCDELTESLSEYLDLVRCLLSDAISQSQPPGMGETSSQVVSRAR